jgi:opacity protein-like surface antigen
MKRQMILMLLLLITGAVAEAQTGSFWRVQRLELTGGIGPTQFFGDIGGFTPEENVLGFKDISLRQTRFNVSLGANYRVMQEVTVRLNLSYGMFNANDDKGSNVARGFRSTTNFFETALIGEYYIIRNSAEDSYLFTRGRGLQNRPRRLADPRSYNFRLQSMLDLYVFAGIGSLGWSVSANDALAAHENFRDGGFTAIVPAGVGAKYVLSPEISLGLELGGRYSFSDYLEGYTSDYSSFNDVYYFLNATVTYKFASSPAFMRR